MVRLRLSHEARRLRRQEICERAKQGVDPRQLAEIYDLNYASIMHYLKRGGLRYKKKRRGRAPMPTAAAVPFGNVVTPTRPLWDFVNWEVPDSMIANVLRVSRERVRQVRLARKMPPSPDKFQTGKIRLFRIFCRNNAAELRGKSARDIIIRAGQVLPIRVASAILTELGVEHVMKSIGSPGEFSALPWHKLNWALPNVDLFHIWKIVSRTQAFSRSRTDFQKGPATLKKGTPEHQIAVDREVRIAQDWLDSPEGKIAALSSRAMQQHMEMDGTASAD